MLERAALKIADWRWHDAATLTGFVRAGWGRVITDAATAESLGFVRACRLRPFAWLTPQQLDVCETEDGALLMTLEHSWFGWGRWHVVDAENRGLGAVLGPHLIDADGFRWAAIERGVDEDVVRRTSGERCGTFRSDDTTLELRFAAELSNPFLRMLVLGAALAQAPLPG